MDCHRLGRSAACLAAKVCSRVVMALLAAWASSRSKGKLIVVSAMCSVSGCPGLFTQDAALLIDADAHAGIRWFVRSTVMLLALRSMAG